MRVLCHPYSTIPAAGMSQWGAPWPEADAKAEESVSALSPVSTVFSPKPSSAGSELWMTPEPPQENKADRHLSAARVPPLALPVTQHTELDRRTKAAATTVSLDTPELAEAGPSAPAHASRKPPRPFSRQTRQYASSILGEPDHVPVNWIGDSTDHAGYRPTNTASFSNHEPDIVRVATFSTQGQKTDEIDPGNSKHSMPCHSSKRRWPAWTLLGVVAGTAVGVAYKLLVHEGLVSRIGAPHQQCAPFHKITPQVTDLKY